MVYGSLAAQQNLQQHRLLPAKQAVAAAQHVAAARGPGAPPPAGDVLRS